MLSGISAGGSSGWRNMAAGANSQRIISAISALAAGAGGGVSHQLWRRSASARRSAA